MRFIISLLGVFLLTFSLGAALQVDDFTIDELGSDGFVVSWTTDEPASSQILYGTTGRLGQGTSSDSILKTEHQVQVSELNSNTVYFFRATGTTSQGESYYSVVSVTKTANANSPAPTGFGVSEFWLVNADTDTEIRRLVDGETIDLLAYAHDISIIAKAYGATESILFYLDGQYYNTESAEPYSLNKDVNYVDIQAWNPQLRTYTIQARPYDQDNRYQDTTPVGAEGRSLAITVNFIEEGSDVVITPDPGSSLDASFGVKDIWLIESDSGDRVRKLNNGDVIDLSQYSEAHTIEAETFGNTGSVVFFKDGGFLETQNNPPYNLWEDASDWIKSYGTFTLTTKSYSADEADPEPDSVFSAQSTQGNSKVIELTFIDSPNDIRADPPSDPVSDVPDQPPTDNTPDEPQDPIDPPTSSFGVQTIYLVESDNGNPVRELTTGNVIDLTQYDEQLTIAIEVYGNSESVIFRKDGEYLETDNNEPYRLWSDLSDWVQVYGEFDLSVEVFSQDSVDTEPGSSVQGSGVAGEAKTIGLRFTGQPQGTQTSIDTPNNPPVDDLVDTPNVIICSSNSDCASGQTCFNAGTTSSYCFAQSNTGGSSSSNADFQIGGQATFACAQIPVFKERVLNNYRIPGRYDEASVIKNGASRFYEDVVKNNRADAGRWDNFDPSGSLLANYGRFAERYEPLRSRANYAQAGTYPNEAWSSERLHDAALLAFVLNDEPGTYTIAGVTKSKDIIAQELAMGVWKELHAMARDDKLDASNGGRNRPSWAPSRTNSRYGTAERFEWDPTRPFPSTAGVAQQGVAQTAGSPFWISAAKMTKNAMTYGLIYDMVKNDPEFIAQENYVNWWFRDWAYFTYENLEFNMNHFAGNSWRNFQRNWQTGFPYNPRGSAQAYTWYDSNGNGQNRVQTIHVEIYNNRILDHFGYLHAYATLFQDEQLEDWMYDWYKSFFMISQYPDGTISEKFRNGAGHDQRWPLNYPEINFNVLANMAGMHAIAAQQGFAENPGKYFEFATSMGSNELYATRWEDPTSGGSKGLKLLADDMARMHRTPAYGGVYGQRFNEAGSMINTASHPTTMLFGYVNMWYDDEELDQANKRNGNGYNSYFPHGKTAMPSERGQDWGVGITMGGELAVYDMAGAMKEACR